MADQVTIYNLEQENNVLDNDYVPVSDGNSTRKLNLSSNFAQVNLSNIGNIDEYGARVLVDSFFNYVDIEREDSGFILERPDRYILKTALYSVNKKLPGNEVLTDEPNIDYTRDIRIDDRDVPVTFLGKELTVNGSFLTSIDDLCAITNINAFDQFTTDSGVKVNDYVQVKPDTSKNLERTYYLLTNFDSETGAIESLVLPNAHNTSSWKFIGFSDEYSHVSLNEILKDLSDSRARFDLLDVKVSERTSEDGTIFTTLPQFINSKISIYKYVRLYNLLQAGTAGTKGDEPETVSGLYSYDSTKDYGDSRFARKTLNNLKPNGTEQLYDRTTDWGDNRFAHKALDNVKSANSTDVYVEDYDSTKDYGNSRFARKNLNNLRSATYDILNNKVPSKITSGNTTKQFLVNDEFSFSGNSLEVKLDYKTYTLNNIDTGATNFKTDYTYSLGTQSITLPASIPGTNAGIITSDQATQIKKALISVNEITGTTDWDTVSGNITTTEEREYYNKSTYKKIITTDVLKGTVANKTSLPNSGNQIGDKYKVTADGKFYYWNGVEWKNSDEEKIYVINPNGLLDNGEIIVTGYNIPVTALDWDSTTSSVKSLRSVGERIEQLENLGVYLGAYDITGLKYSGTNLVVDNTTYYRVNTVTQNTSGSGYKSNDIVSCGTSVTSQVMYMKYNGTTTLDVITTGALFTQQTINAVTVNGGSGTGKKVNISATNTTTRLPRNLSEKPGASVNDFASVRYDPLHKGVATRYVIKSIDASGNFTWEFDIYLEYPERDFTQFPIAHNELQNDAVQANNIKDSTISIQKLAFSIDAIQELTGNVDFNTIQGDGTFVTVGTGSTNGPTANTNLNWNTTLLSRIDNSRWWIQQYFIKNSNGTIINGYQIARNFVCPGVQLMRCMIPPADITGTTAATWPTATSTDYRNWSWGYAQYQ